MGTFRFIAFGIALVLPLVALAQTSSNSTLSALESQLAALEQQINAMTGASASVTSSTTASTASTAPTTSTAAANNLCPDLSRTLSLGSSGADVAGLQEFLTQQGLFHAIVTGYFGTLTQSAVAQWQEQNNIVNGGDAVSTGLGVVGPHTRSAMEANCQPGQTTATNSQCMKTLPPSTECPTSWQPIHDANGCTMYYQCSISLPNGTGSSSGTATSTTSACPVAQKPVCSGTVQTFQAANGCSAYECVL